MARTRGLSDYLRFESPLPGYLREFAILMTARHDATWAVERFGEQGVVEIVSLVGYYTMISMILNTVRTPLPPGATPALAPFPY